MGSTYHSLIYRAIIWLFMHNHFGSILQKISHPEVRKISLNVKCATNKKLLKMEGSKILTKYFLEVTYFFRKLYI
jgi:hypothetical protein